MTETNILDFVFSKGKMTRYSQFTLLYLIGQDLAGKELPTPQELQNGRFPNAYAALGELLRAGYITGSPSDYKLDYQDLAPFRKTLMASFKRQEKPVTEAIPSVLSLCQQFKLLHKKIRTTSALNSSKDLVMMRGLCKKIKPNRIKELISQFFTDPFVTAYSADNNFSIEDFIKYAKKIERIK